MPTSTRILLYTDDHSVGGVAQYNHAVLCGLADRGYRVLAAQSRLDNPLVRRQKECGVDHVWLDFEPQRDFGRTISNTDDAHRVYQVAKPEFIVFSNCCPVSNFAAKEAGCQEGIPFV